MKIDPRQTLIDTARHFYAQGWMVGTAGNLSARLPDGSFWITASGCSKGELTSNDLIHLTLDGTVLEQSTPDHHPSAEASIHQAIYTRFPDARACYHVHSIEANLVSRFVQGDTLPLPPLEMLKGLGIEAENPQVSLPIFDNQVPVSQIATEISDRFKSNLPKVSALLIRDHGVTVWADSAETARNRVELVEYLFRYMVTARLIGV